MKEIKELRSGIKKSGLRTRIWYMWNKRKIEESVRHTVICHKLESLLESLEARHLEFMKKQLERTRT